MPFFRWINEIRKELKALITGSLLLGVMGLYQAITAHQIAWWAYTIIACVFLGWAFFGAWIKQYKRAQELEKRIYDGRPIFVLELRRHSAKGWSFYLTNCGYRMARYVQLEMQTSYAEHYDLHFLELPLLEPQKEPTVINWWVSKSRSIEGSLLDNEMLFAFLNDVPVPDNPGERAALIWFDVCITFRDMDETSDKAVVRFCFDIQSQMLKAVAVPYTERKSSPAKSRLHKAMGA